MKKCLIASYCLIQVAGAVGLSLVLIIEPGKAIKNATPLGMCRFASFTATHFRTKNIRMLYQMDVFTVKASTITFRISDQSE